MRRPGGNEGPRDRERLGPRGGRPAGRDLADEVELRRVPSDRLHRGEKLVAFLPEVVDVARPVARQEPTRGAPGCQADATRPLAAEVDRRTTWWQRRRQVRRSG